MRRVCRFTSFCYLTVLAGIFCITGCFLNIGKPRILVFNNEENALHESTEVAIDALRRLCAEHDIRVEVKNSGHVARVFTEKGLRRYSAVVFLNTAGNMLNAAQEAQFQRYIQAGGGFAGIHTAIDTEHGWKWYGKLVGARFSSRLDVQDATLHVNDRNHPATRHLDTTWQRRDEWFNLHDLSPGVRVLLTLDEKSCRGGSMGVSHPVSWRHEFDGGRVFITAMGHTKESYGDPVFLQHLLGGIQYAIGENQALRYENIPPPRPDETVSTGFVKTSVECDLDEPMALDMLPDGKIVFIERKGAIRLYDPVGKELRTVARLPVYVINELGLLGMALDPNWEKNHWIYLYYSEPGAKEINRLSRFVFTGDSLHAASETTLLEIAIQRDECCHYAGCVKFDTRGCLYLSVGDNSDFSESEGYAPIDERPGQDMGDAQRSAANSMDLRGKILRIKPLPDGSYLCPAGNMFTEQDIVVSPFTQMLQDDPLWTGFVPHGQPHVLPAHGPAAPIRLPGFGNRSAGRPEIYAMGCRNPFRISIDSRRNFLFWGDPGPQAGLPDSMRGPEGFDEINCASGPGFFGWPYFIGNNKAYRDYDFERKKTGPAFDPQHPLNDSPRNTGIKNLPPAQPALIWYPYASSPEFPSLANGASCAMAGPVYYSDQYPAASRFPDEFDGNVIIYDWMRNWMVAVALDSAGRLIRLAPLAESVPLSRPIDMMFDKNGSLWVLEYGTKWFDPNPDACLSRIDYRRGSGRDTAAVSSPVVHWDFGERNRSFYRPGELLNYKIMVTDPQAGSLEDGGIPASAVAARISYTPAPFHPDRKKRQRPGGQNKTALQRGENLVNSSDCKACHDAERQINGPAYQSIAARYDSDKTAIPRLVSKVIKGGSGVWGDRAMSAHPQLKEQEAREMVRWILSLSDPANRALPLQGAYSLTAPASDKGGLSNAPGAYIFQATYTGNNTASQATRSASETIIFRLNLQQAEHADHISQGARVKRLPGAGSPVLDGLKDKYFFGFKQIDLRGIISVTLRLSIPNNNAGTIELRLDTPDGRLLGSTHTPASNNPGLITFSDIPLSVDQTSWSNDDALHDIYFVVKQEKKSPRNGAAVDWVRFNF